MKKSIINVDEKKGVYQITTTDERWYALEGTADETGLPGFTFVPSVTWITNYVYKGIGFYKWLADKGWNEAEAIKVEAGDKGSKIHTAIERLLDGLEIKMEDKFYSQLTEQDEELTPEEYGAILSFRDWFDATKPEVIMKETTVWSKEHNFAGTVDCVAKIGDQVYILDWKSSQGLWPSMEAQLSAYKQALKEMGKKTQNAKLAILQIGYRRNKRGWKFTEVEDSFDSLFLPAQKFWNRENKNQQPKQVEMPLSIKLDLSVAKTKEEEKLMKAIKTPATPKKLTKKGVVDNKLTKKDAK